MATHEENHPSESPPIALRRHVVQRLLAKIIRGDLGPGTRLISSGLAFQLGVSPTPVREALVELEQSGMVELVHHRGAVVKPFGRTELRDFYHVLRLLRCDAVRLACGRVAASDVDALQGNLQSLDGEPVRHACLAKDIFAIDRRIRHMLVAHCGNKWLVAELGRYDSIETALRGIAEDGRIDVGDAIQPAIELAAALGNNDAEAGARAMHRHIDVLAAVVETTVFRT